MVDWTEKKGPVEGTSVAASLPRGPGVKDRSAPISGRNWSDILIDALGNRSIGELLLFWLWVIVGFGLIYWAAGAWRGQGLQVGAVPIETTWEGLLVAVYFSFVTALSIGYGDVVPVGLMRGLAIVEGAGALLIFGCVISKLVSRRQEELTEEIHRITFEDRLDRLRTNLHLVLSETNLIAKMCSDPSIRPEQVLTRVDSVAAVFAGELQAIHDLLYRPQEALDEQVLESILANLAAVFRELNDLLVCLPGAEQRSSTLKANLRSMAMLANEICGECVPRAYAPTLKDWMDRIQELARKIV
ncbi:MAG: potassium channel family protein [Candidatus Binatia bacterium]